MLSAINSLRRSRSRKALRGHTQLARLAQRHARAMAKANRIYHDPKQLAELPPVFSVGGEIVGVTHYGERNLFDLWHASDAHRHVMLSNSYTHAGVGLIRRRGKLWGCVRFAG